MGRPLNDKYFGNRMVGGVGGSVLTAVALGTAGTGYSQGLTATVSAPQIAGGSTATVSVAVTPATGAISSYTVTSGGSGYTSAPTVTLVKPTTVITGATGSANVGNVTVTSVSGIYNGMEATGTGIGTGALVTGIAGLVVSLSVINSAPVTGNVTFTDIGASGVPGARTIVATPKTNQDVSPSINVTAFTVLGGASRANSDIVKQVGSRRFKIHSSDGTGVCKLVARVPAAAGEASMVATDSLGKTYYVTKITEHKALLTQFGATGHEFASDTMVKWTFGAAVLNYSVQVASL